MPEFTYETLNKMKVNSKNTPVTTLSSICDNYTIIKGMLISKNIQFKYYIVKNKEQYIQNILSRYNIISQKSSELEQVENFMKIKSFSGNSAIHQMYVA